MVYVSRVLSIEKSCHGIAHYIMLWLVARRIQLIRTAELLTHRHTSSSSSRYY